MGVAQRNKGAVAEREVATLLEAWWGQQLGEPGCRFVRAPMSGGWHGPAVRKEFRASGDLLTTARQFPWTVEIKRREGWAWKTFLAGKASPVWEWWLQAQTQAREQGLSPMLWLRHSREDWCVLVAAADVLAWPKHLRVVPVHWTCRWPLARGTRPARLPWETLRSLHPRGFMLPAA